jgi:hypothetical protein
LPRSKKKAQEKSFIVRKRAGARRGGGRGGRRSLYIYTLTGL